MWRSLLKLYPEPGSENEKEEEKPVVIVPVLSPVKPLTPKKLWEKKKAKMADGEVKALSKKRSQVKGKLTRILHAVQPSTQPGALPGAQAREADVLPPQLRVHQRSVEKYYGEFCEVHNMIMDLVEDDEGTKQQEAKWVEFEQLYNRTLVVLETLLTAHDRPIQAVLPAGQATQQVIIHQQALRAPLPTFDGRYENWAKFKAMFQDLMRSSPDSDAVKLYHLDKALVGEAEGKIDLRTIQDNNYQEAWNQLEEQYENTRLIIDLHIQGILQLKKMDKRSSKELRDVVERCSRHVEGLRFHKQELLGVSELIVVNILAAALDRETRELWEATIEKGELPTYQATIDFLKKRCHILERCEQSDPVASVVEPTISKKLPSKPSAKMSAAAMTTSEIKCELCGGNHPNYKCSTFCSMSVPQRLAKLREVRACFNCLRTGHHIKTCPSEKTCKCGEKHHNLLHMDKPREQASSQSEATPIPQPTNEQATGGTGSVTAAVADANPKQTTSCCSSGVLQTSRPVLLQTAIIDVMDKHGRLHPCRTLLDSGSQAHILSAAMARTLDLPLMKCNVTVIGANAVKTPARRGVNLNFSSRYSDCQDTISCLISEKPTGIIPSGRIDASGWGFPSGLQLADPHFCEPNDIDLVMASNYVWDLLRTEKVKLHNGTVTLRETDLGWIVTGTYDPFDEVSQSFVHSNVVRLDALKEVVEKFWTVEELAETAPHSAENDDVEQHFVNTHHRDESGRYVVQLPFRDTVSELDDNRTLALRRFSQLERRLSRNPDLKLQYSAFIDEYEALGHCKEVFEEQDPPDTKKFYLPHHAVLKPSSSSTKLRVVFDASAKSSRYSLNDVLKVGPTVQSDLFSILLHFRRYLIAFSADAVKMYRQVQIVPEHRPFQRIFWRKEPSDRLRVLELNTVTYGTASAPFLATRCLTHLAESAKDRFPMTAKKIKEDVYVDDMLSGADTAEEAQTCVKEVKELLAEGGFQIKKWCSNSEAVLEGVPEEDREKLVKIDECSVSEGIKALGILWDPKQDEFRFQNVLSESDILPITKAKVLSDIAKLFDPLGLISPVIVCAKVIMQKLWADKLGWADPLQGELLKEWLDFRSSLDGLKDIRIPRCAVIPGAVRYEVHGYSDASTVAYGACVYLKCFMPDRKTVVSRLLCSKSRVAPLKQLTIPKLELEAAQLLSLLVVKVLATLDLEIAEVVLKSDSQIVLAWLRRPLDTLEVFQRNRVAKINALTKGYTWAYVRTSENPADFVSRGQLPAPLSRNNLWWEDTPSTTSAAVDPAPIHEQELPGLVASLSNTVESELLPVFTRFSDFRKLQRVVAYVCRFIQNLKCKRAGQPTSRTNYLTIPETREALKCIVRCLQVHALLEDYNSVKQSGASHRLARLAPILDSDGCLRVGGRIQKSSLPEEAKHQLILPRHPVTESLIRAMHIENLHIGPSGLLAATRQKFWPLDGRSITRKITTKCICCFRAKPRGIEQFMGQLPDERVNVAAPFEFTGVDYAGPMLVKQGKYRPKVVKAYIAVFVCMATKNVHLELVSELTAEAFIAALERFINRRGMVRKLFSDNGTNFVGASGMLRDFHRLLSSDLLLRELHELLLPKEIEWSFIPPRAPNFGGLWEAGVKSVKTHLKRTLVNATLTFEEMATMLTHIEAILNSRPLYSASDCPGDVLPITPAHLQIGRPLQPVPKPSCSSVPDNRLPRWRYLDKLREHFWDRWSREYLTSLQVRGKWHKKTANVRPGMVVLLIEDNLPPQSWKLAIVIKTYPGPDQLVRVVDVKVGNKIFQRSISKLAPLPTEDNDQLRQLPEPSGLEEIPSLEEASASQPGRRMSATASDFEDLRA